jgi:hypothetical protein
MCRASDLTSAVQAAIGSSRLLSVFVKFSPISPSVTLVAVVVRCSCRFVDAAARELTLENSADVGTTRDRTGSFRKRRYTAHDLELIQPLDFLAVNGAARAWAYGDPVKQSRTKGKPGGKLPSGNLVSLSPVFHLSAACRKAARNRP